LADTLHSFPATKAMREIKKLTTSERTRISYRTALPVTTDMVLLKKNHKQLTEAAPRQEIL
jgi:hypothetical protein